MERMASKLTWPNHLAPAPMSLGTIGPAEANPADNNTIAVKATNLLIVISFRVEKFRRFRCPSMSWADYGIILRWNTSEVNRWGS